MTVKIFRNKLVYAFKTCFFMGLILSVLGLTGWLLAGGFGALAALGLGVFFLLFASEALSSSLVMRLYGASPLDYAEAPGLYRILENLSRRASLAVLPRLYFLDSPEPNAFAVGRGGEAGIALSRGLLSRLERDEVAGVLAHEISHLAADDGRLLSMADSLRRLTRVLSFAGQIGLLIFLPVLLFRGESPSLLAFLLLAVSPGLSYLLLLSLTRTREYEADANAALLTGDPLALARALRKISYEPRTLLDIFFPSRGRSAEIPEALRTHPNTEERIRRLNEMARNDEIAYEPAEVEYIAPENVLPDSPLRASSWSQSDMRFETERAPERILIFTR